jgi:ferric-dicitrate binding protein FerR (iron transport regulator)
MDKYHNFNVEDFAEDPQFYAWVTNPDPESEDFWNQWIEKHPEKYAIITEARTLIGALDMTDDDVSEERVQSLWNKIEDGIDALDQYADFTAEDFADDPSFFAWVTEPDEATEQRWTAWLAQNPNKQAVVKKAKSLIGILQFAEDDIPQSKIDNLWNRIDSRIGNLWSNIEEGMEAIDQYADFTAEDFANDPSFFAWVTEPDEAANQHWHTWLQQHPEKESLVAEAKRLIGLIQVKEDDIPQSKIDDLWSRIDGRIGNLWSNIEEGMNAIDEYADFTAEDFANDPSFFVWATEPDEETNQHWNTWLEQNPEKESLVAEAKALVNGDATIEIPQTRIDNLWDEINSGISQDEKQANVTRSISMRKVYMAAASVVILLGAFFIFRNMTTSTPPTVASTQAGEQKSVTLPDGSTATLNADSRISYQADQWSNRRNVDLNGEAFFDVKKGKKFQVNTPSGNMVEVLGTSFNVYTRQKDFKVECMTGKVKLTDATKKNTLVLAPGMGSRIEAGKLKTYKFDKSEVSNWRKGEFQYQETPLGQVFAEIERQFNVKVAYKTDVKNRLYTGFFSNKDLASALKFICEPMSLKYTIKNDSTKTVVIQ